MPKFLEVTDTAAARFAIGVQASSVDTFSVKDFGAVGNNSTDDTAAIQAAIDAAESRVVAGSNARVVVYFPAGRYRVNGGLTVNKNDVHFIGAGQNATRIQRSVISETPVITALGLNFTLHGITIRNDNASYGDDDDGERSVAIRLEHPDGDLWENSVDAHVESCFISGFYAAISIFGQGLTVLDCTFSRLVHGAILDFPDTADLVQGDVNQSYVETAFRKFRFEGIFTQVTRGGFIKNAGANAVHLRSCIISNFTADLGVRIWEGVLANTLITNWQVEQSAETSNPAVFDLADGSHDSVICNGRVLGRKQDGDIAERAMLNVMVCGDVESLTVTNLHIQNVQRHGFDFTGSVNGLHMSDCHFKSVGYDGADFRQILFRDNDVQAFLDNLTFDIDAVTTATPITALDGGSTDTLIVGANLRIVDEDQTTVDIVNISDVGTFVENGKSTRPPTVGNWKLGDVVWNKTAAGNPLGWRCTTRGVPGTWTAILPSGTGTLNFGEISAYGHLDLTLTVTGAATGDCVSLAVPTAAVTTGVAYTAWVSAADEVTVRAHNYTAGTPNPASGSFKATIVR